MISLPAFAADKAKAKKIFEANKNTVVFISAVLNMEITVAGRNQNREQQVEILGTAVNKDGLIVTSLTAIDPSILSDGQTVNTPNGPMKLSIKSSYKEVKIMLADGTEIPAKVVLKDPDLNLAFIVPDKSHEDYQKVDFPFVNIANSAEASILDDLVNVNKLGKDFYRQAGVTLGYVRAIVKKPRTFILATLGSNGTPVFNIEGNFVGLAIPKITNKKAAMGILPAAEVKKLAAQAAKSQ